MNRQIGILGAALLSLCLVFSTAHATESTQHEQETESSQLKKKKPKKKKPKKGGAKKKDPLNKKVATIGVDHGIVFSSNKTMKDGSGMKVDLIVYKQGKGFKVNAGRKGSSYNPLHDLGTQKFSSLGDVPCFKPGAKAKNKFKKKLVPGQGFTVIGNKSSGTYRLRIQKISGGKITFEHDKCN